MNEPRLTWIEDSEPAVRFAALYAQICRDADAAERRWIEGLRGQGVKAAHPNDGWVKRERRELHLAYPQFNDGVGVGDKVALGTGSNDTIIVRITEIKRGLTGLLYYTFEGM